MTADPNATAGPMHDHILNSVIAKHLGPKSIVTHLPISTSPLVKTSADDAGTLDREWVFINGLLVFDIANENTDPEAQLSAYRTQSQDLANETGAAVTDQNIDVRLLHAQLYGLPPLVGAGIGIERLVMGITGVENIRDVIPFPSSEERLVRASGAVTDFIVRHP